MDSIKVKILNGPEVIVKKGTIIKELSEKFKDLCKYDILVAKLNNQLFELNCEINDNCNLEFLDITNIQGFRVFQRSASFLLVYAVKAVLGHKAGINVEHTINKNFYCEIVSGIEINDELVEKIEKKMNETVAANYPFERLTMPVDAGKTILEKFDNKSMIKSLRYLNSYSMNLYKLDFYYDYFYGALVPSTGYLKPLKLHRNGDGIFLQLPKSSNPQEMYEMKDLKKISHVFNESAKWARILRVDTVSSLNEAVCNSTGSDIIRINEALHEKRLAGIADMVVAQSKSVVLLAGPSSSGKTTTAERLCVHFRVLGLKPHIISLDNYFFNRDLAPLDEFGKPDFESINYVDAKLLNSDLSNLLKGEKVEIPTYNFITGCREYKGNFLELSKDDILIIEGIHGLNEVLTHSVPQENKFKIFISALTQLNIDQHNRIPTSDTRLIRRIVRDHRTRGYSAAQTIAIWNSVMRGEEKNIFPFQESADAIFNSALVYEMCILKQYIQPLLFNIDNSYPEYTEARRLLKFLDSFVSMPPDDVPNNSIIREFIGGSCFRT